MDPFSWLAAAGTAGGTAGAAGTLAPLGAASSAAAAATTAAGITAGSIVPTVAGGSGLAAGAGAVAKTLAKTVAGAGAASLLAPTPKIPAAPRPPTVDDAAQRVAVADRLRAKKGGAAAILTGTLGDTSTPQTATKKLLGQ